MGIQSENIELISNKDTSTSLGMSDIKYPSQKAVKMYVDALGLDVTTIKNHGLNIMLNAFRIAQQGSLSLLNMVDQFIDEYEDESGVDTINSINESYNSTDDYYTPLYQEVVDQQQTLSDNNASFGDIANSEYRNAQGFQLSGTKTVTAIELYINSKSGSPTGNWTIRIETNNAGVPSGTLANVNATKTVSSIDSGTLKVSFTTPFSLSASTTYWIVLLCDNQSTNNNWQMARQIGSNAYANGTSATSTNLKYMFTVPLKIT